MLVFFISGNIYGINQTGLYSGFLFSIENNILWFTAGHVIDEITQIIQDNKDHNLCVRWLDGTVIPGAESIPVNYNNLKTFSGTKWNFDFGSMFINFLEVENIAKNGHSQPLAFEISAQKTAWEPEGYYVVGFPTDHREFTSKPIQHEKIFNFISAQLVLLPIKRVPFPGVTYFQDGNSTDFYGEILDYSDIPISGLDVKGMSGGPIFSIGRDKSGHFRYQICGIQSSWNKIAGIIRAVPFESVIDILHFAFSGN